MDEFLKIHPFAVTGVCKKEIKVTDEAPKSANIAMLPKELICYIASFLTFDEWGMSQKKAGNTKPSATEANPPADQPTQVENLGEHLDVIPAAG